MQIKSFSFVIIILIFLTACTPLSTPTPGTPSPFPTFLPPTFTPSPTSPPPEPSPTPLPTFAPTSTATPPAIPRFVVPDIPRTKYNLTVELDYAAHSLTVTEHITYTNTTPGALNEIALVVDARRYPGAFDLEHLEWADGSRINQFYWTDTRLTVKLSEALPASDKIHLRIAYNLQLFDSSKKPDNQPYPLGYTEDQMNLGDWYPYIPPYLPQLGWQVHKPWFYGEHLVFDSSDFEVAIRPTGAMTDVVIAAAAPAHTDGEWQRYKHLAARSFAWSASPYYQVAAQSIEIPGSEPVVVASYYLPLYENAGKSLAQTMAQALLIYSEMFGAYPRPLLSAVQAEFLDGMEYDGLFFLGSNFYDWYKEDPAQFLTILGAHETAHQWWYGVVGSDPALEPWLDETLCTYSERLYYEKAAPQALEWWWYFRIRYYNPGGWVDMSIYDVPNGPGHYRSYRDTVYFNGVLFLEDLRLLIGDEAFFAALKEYAASYAYTRATATDFFAAIRRHTSIDIKPVTQEYFQKNP